MVIKCPKCQTENPDTQKFCGECGTPLQPTKGIGITKTLETHIEEYPRGSKFADRYNIIEKLGTGGMGAVYRVEDKNISQDIALKLIKSDIASDKKTIERFRNELKTTRMISHRNVCRMFDLAETEGTYYITMEYVSGEDMKSFIRRSGKLDIPKAISIAKEVCEGLAEAHRLGVVHRDLKSNNVMIDEEGNARIMDFGIARSQRAKGLTGEGIIIGTPEYMSPEQAEAKHVDHRSDIYSLGIILYEMVTGQLPFEGDTPLAIAIKHKGEMPKDPKEINPQIQEDFNNLILNCLEKDKDKRYQSAEELRSELTNIERGITTKERTVPAKKPLTSREITVTFGLKKLLIPAVIVVTVIIIGLFLWRPWSQGEAPIISTDKPSLAIMYFENNTGDESLDHWRKALSELLITDLMQSKYFRMVSGDKIYDILQQMNLLEAKSYSSKDLREISIRARATHVLRGGFTKAGDTFRIDIILKEAGKGESIGSERVEGKGEGSFYSMIDELTKRIKANFKLTAEEIARDIDKELDKITTSFPEAYNYYLEGRKYHVRGDNRRAIKLYEKAVEIDPEFASGYRIMASANLNLGNRTKAKEYYQKAIELSNRVSDRERYFIQADYYRLSEATYDKAFEAYNKLLELYPDEWIGNNNFGVLYRNIEEWDKALERFKTSVKLHKVMVSCNNLANMYEKLGLYNEAKKVYEDYLENVSDDDGFHIELGYNYLFQRKYDFALEEAEKAFLLDPSYHRNYYLKGDIYHMMGDLPKAEEEYLKSLEAREKDLDPIARLAALYLTQGKLEKSREQAESAIKLAQELNNTIAEANSHFYLGYLYWKSGNIEGSLKEADKAINFYIEHDFHSNYRRSLGRKGILLVEKGTIDEAQRLATELNDLFQKSMNKKDIRYYYLLMGYISLKRKNITRAIDLFHKGKSLLPFENDTDDEHAYFLEPLALAYYNAGDLEKSLAEYERISLLTSGRMGWGDIYAKSFYMLGKIYEEQGYTAKAIEHYEKFLDLWKEADPRIAAVEDARERLVGLKGEHP
jgi:serine/threonine protein kinase/Tfp pilus assembly protein PilF